jgi:hypothetical protein
MNGRGLRLRTTNRVGCGGRLQGEKGRNVTITLAGGLMAGRQCPGPPERLAKRRGMGMGRACAVKRLQHLQVNYSQRARSPWLLAHGRCRWAKGGLEPATLLVLLPREACLMIVSCAWLQLCRGTIDVTFDAACDSATL